MCGICGFIGIEEEDLLERMTAALTHRGPDSEGFFRDGDVGLGHRRLSIIDVSGGRQPIANEDQSLLLIANGEIYNHLELRRELESRGHRFRTHSDNEVVLHLYEDEGPECVQRLNGMFALAIYDRVARRLFLARDRLGIKPLYYMATSSGLLFGSETKSILQYRRFTPSTRPSAIRDYLALRYAPGPGTMFREISKLPAAHYAVADAEGNVTSHRYWKPPLIVEPLQGSDEELLEGFAERFETSIRRRLMSEVPFGAYLSGGLDSSVIVGAMSRLVSDPVRTFSVGFDYQHDELEAAAETARRFDCDHTEIHCHLSDLELLPDIVYHLDEPVGDPIIIPMYLLAREAKKRVTVVLTGEGADETLGGYLFHQALLTGRRITRYSPGWLQRGLLRPAVAMMPASLLNLAFDYPADLGQRGKTKLLDFLELLESDRLEATWRHLISLYDQREFEGLFTRDFSTALAAEDEPLTAADPEGIGLPDLNRILDIQFDHWLPDDILMKQDKLSMASAIEARVPFLDHELVEYDLSLPPRSKIRGRLNKFILRRYAAGLLPDETANRKKMPFYAPVEKFFREPGFQDLLEETLSEKRVRERGVFRPQAIAALRREMELGEFMHVKQIFSLMVLELWHQSAIDSRRIVAPD